MKGITISTYLDKLPIEDKHALLLDNLFATHGKMTNLLRRKALTLIQNLSSQAKEKSSLAKAFEPFFFVDTPITDLYRLYGDWAKVIKRSLI